MVGALVWVAGGAGNRADWAWLTANFLVQDGSRPLHIAAWQGQEVAIKVLVEAKADIRVNDKVRWVQSGRVGGAACGLEVAIWIWRFEPESV